jgi:hypothetical protein
VADRRPVGCDTGPCIFGYRITDLAPLLIVQLYTIVLLALQISEPHGSQVSCRMRLISEVAQCAKYENAPTNPGLRPSCDALNLTESGVLVLRKWHHGCRGCPPFEGSLRLSKQLSSMDSSLVKYSNWLIIRGKLFKVTRRSRHAARGGSQQALPS